MCNEAEMNRLVGRIKTIESNGWIGKVVATSYDPDRGPWKFLFKLQCPSYRLP